MEEKELHNQVKYVQQKLLYAGHLLRGSSCFNALRVLEGKFDGETRGRSRRTWIGDVIGRRRQWMQKKV